MTLHDAADGVCYTVFKHWLASLPCRFCVAWTPRADLLPDILPEETHHTKEKLVAWFQEERRRRFEQNLQFQSQNPSGPG